MGAKIRFKIKRSTVDLEEPFEINWEALFLKGFVVLAVILILGLIFFCFWSFRSL